MKEVFFILPLSIHQWTAVGASPLAIHRWTAAGGLPLAIHWWTAVCDLPPVDRLRPAGHTTGGPLVATTNGPLM